MRPILGILSLASVLALAGCGQLDLTPEGDPSRVLTGEVDMGNDVTLPADTVVTVRVVGASVAGMPLEVLGSQTISNPGVAPITFRVEYRAEDETLRKGLNIEVRVSFGGRVRFYNKNNYAVTLGNAADTHRVSVNPVGQ